ncbi:hypothetical protein WJX75_001096 [Coccomyxa subellipsoidea]|uniref:S1 motif domain-containing protein n=1 Tax=Coccomyxa subellipsoidea TaxID=248742 RepID=A0ABR2YDI2_9CHLO
MHRCSYLNPLRQPLRRPSAASRQGSFLLPRGVQSLAFMKEGCQKRRRAPVLATGKVKDAATAPANNGAQKPAITQAWKEVLELQKNGTTWTGKITAVNKGGVVVDVNGLRGFIPMSRLDPGRLPKTDFALEDIEGLVGQPVSAKVIQVNIPSRQLVLSEQATMVEQLAASLQTGDVVEGIVTRTTDYGAFVSLRSPDGNLHGAVGLIHITELSWDKVMTPEDVVQPGSLVHCKVIKVDKEKLHINLSLKQMESDPLLENLDGLLPLDTGSVTSVPANLPAAIEDLCAALANEPGVESVDIGRQVEEKRAVSQDLELWISKEVVKDGYNLVVRTGRLVQEIHVTTDLPSEGMKESVQRVLRQLV